MNLLDVIEGKGPAPRLVLSLIQRLPDTSMTSALVQGGSDFLGWGADRHLLANLYDALNTNTRVSGNWAKGKPPKIDAYPRPTKKQLEQSVTVASLFERMSQRI